MENFPSLDNKLENLNALRPLPPATLKSVRENEILDWTYNSNGIEGNTLTLKETKVVLEGITVGGKSIKEHLEAINHKDAILFIEELVKKDKMLTERDIRDVHRLVLKDIDIDNAGRYRTENVIISGAKHVPPNHVHVAGQMASLVNDLASWVKKHHPIVVAARLHGEFVKIHPFVDGNGRTARLLMNFIVMKYGYPPLVIKKEQRFEYYTALDTAHTTGDYAQFIKLVAVQAEQALDWYLKICT